MTYAYCESVTAVGTSNWHIRKLTSAGLKRGGGVDTPSLCGNVKPPYGWDIMVMDGKNRSGVCSTCWIASPFYKPPVRPTEVEAVPYEELDEPPPRARKKKVRGKKLTSLIFDEVKLHLSKCGKYYVREPTAAELEEQLKNCKFSIGVDPGTGRDYTGITVMTTDGKIIHSEVKP